MSDDTLVKRDELPLPKRYFAPRTETERRLAEIWRSALSMDKVGIEDRYLDLGGDSFLATAIFTMIEETFGTRIPMTLLVESHTVRTLAGRIDAILKGRESER